MSRAGEPNDSIFQSLETNILPPYLGFLLLVLRVVFKLHLTPEVNLIFHVFFHPICVVTDPTILNVLLQ